MITFLEVIGGTMVTFAAMALMVRLMIWLFSGE